MEGNGLLADDPIVVTSLASDAPLGYTVHDTKLAETTMKCPECDSTNVQKSSALYEQGVFVEEGRSTGLFVTSRGSVGFGLSRSRSRSSSLAAERNSPHRGVSPRVAIAGAGGFILWLLSLQFIDSFLFAVLIPVLILGVMIYLSAPNDTEIEEEKRWELQWYCNQCGTTFIPDKKGSDVEQPLASDQGSTGEPRVSWWQRTFGG